ncbi:MAG: hypothetical protein HY322_09460 [Betaproteobacteria bacterium]|nr:hypothetical protein [Betaproteobacteria bacterium]
MAYRRPSDDVGKKIGRLLRLLAYPRLRDLPPDQWESVLNRARDTEFDAIEWAGVLAGVAFAALVLRSGAGEPGSLFTLYLGQFVLALPLLVVLAGPFYLRRTRRGLDREVEQRNGGDSWNRTYERRDGASRHSRSARPE